MNWEETYKNIQKEMLSKGGFNFDDLTEDQVEVILQPSEAPEIYMCDGEINGDQAFRIWKMRLKETGLTIEQINKAINLNFR